MPVSRIEGTKTPPIRSTPIPTSDLIKQVALTCLKELALSLSFVGALSFFVTSPTAITVIIGSLFAQTMISLFFNSLGGFAKYKASQNTPNTHIYRRLQNTCEWIAAINFALFTGFNGQMLIHEAGHAFALLSVYTKPRPQIAIYPFMGGHTQFYKTTLSYFGKQLGPVGSTCFYIASGPGLTLLISSALLAIGLKIKEKYPHLNKYLIAWSLLDFISHAYYAFSALGASPSNLGHDFVHLSIFGLNPVAATIGILAIPILIHLGMKLQRPQQIRPLQIAV